MKVVFMNASFSGNVHEMIDASLIGMLSSHFDVYSYAQESRIPCLQNTIRSLWNSDTILWNNLKNGSIQGIFNTLKACLREVRVIFKHKKDNPIYIISFLNGISANIINLICILTKIRVVFIAHNDLECINKKKNRLNGFKKYLLYLFYTKMPLGRNLRIMVLGDSILSNVSHYMKQGRMRHFFSFDHPYFSSSQTFDEISFFNKKNIDIGLVGRMDTRPSRGFANLCDFANTVSSDSSIKIHIISSIDKCLINLLPTNIVVRQESDCVLSRNEYDNEIKKMDYLLIPYHQDFYKLTASGAVFEAIVNNKPALMYSTDYFTYLSKKFGNFGIFVDTLNKEQLLIKLHDQKQYIELINEQKKILQEINPLNMSNSFCSLIETLWNMNK